ncbi:hypothetical protein AMEX_G14461 [Astyanax mexicanus]|uniref:Si:ch73-250a16.5 n=1 Tax=Astyanax mexicanus TaxID=7994 RepID=A0A8B9KLU8_ASTMX|nr:hypothetical protein AMEX_G14461 [Astyanax mexicanus]
MSSESRDLLRNEAAPPSPAESARGVKSRSVWEFLLALAVLCVGVLSALAAGPLHAQCFTTWSISIPCFDASSLLVNQIKEWTTDSCPPKSQKCLYSLVAVNGDNIVATHTTPLMRFVDDITLNFSSPNADSCEIQGHSNSRSWYAMFDSGTNYLNMYNLMRGSGLFSSPSFTESTSDRVCTQYSSTRQKLDP